MCVYKNKNGSSKAASDYAKCWRMKENKTREIYTRQNYYRKI